MIKNLLLACLAILLSLFADDAKSSLTYGEFESEIKQFVPRQHESVSDENFRKGQFFLEQTLMAVKNDGNKFTSADYLNIAVAFSTLNESKEHIEVAFQKAIDADLGSICRFVKMGAADFSDEIPELFDKFTYKCKTANVKDYYDFDVDAYIEEGGYDHELVKLIHQVVLDDVKHRAQNDLEKQKPYDLENQKIINALFDKHNTYIGKSLVGEKLELVMFLVIQHSNIEMMQAYLPVIQNAVEQGELTYSTPLKMLIDRIYSVKEGVQVFGSQGMVPLADEDLRLSVMEEYNLAD